MLVVGRVVDTVTGALRDGRHLGPEEFVWAGLLVLGTFAGLAVFQSLSDYCLDSAAQKIRHDLRVSLYAHAQIWTCRISNPAGRAMSWPCWLRT